MATRRFCPADSARTGRSAHCRNLQAGRAASSNSAFDDRASEPDAVVQILQRGEIAFQRVDMCEIGELLMKVVAALADRPPAPVDLTGFHGQQSGDTTQQAGLADAVRPDDLQQLAAVQRERHAAKQMTFAAPQMDVADFELRLGCSPQRPVQACWRIGRVVGFGWFVALCRATNQTQGGAQCNRPVDPLRSSAQAGCKPAADSDHWLTIPPRTRARVAKLVDARDLNEVEHPVRKRPV